MLPLVVALGAGAGNAQEVVVRERGDRQLGVDPAARRAHVAYVALPQLQEYDKKHRKRTLQ